MTTNVALAQDFLENERFPERFPAVSYGFPEVSAVSGHFPLRFSMHRQQERWFPMGSLRSAGPSRKRSKTAKTDVKLVGKTYKTGKTDQKELTSY